MPPRLVLMCGLPGSGKTTLARLLAEEIDAVRLSPDEWLAALGIDLWDVAARDRIEGQQWEAARDVLRRGGRVVMENGFWSRAERDALRSGARELGADVELHYLEASPDELEMRLRDRAATPGSTSAVISRDDLDRFLPLFEAPDADELALYDPPLSRPDRRGSSTTARVG